MRLLVLTQSVDTAEPTLGFFHDWLREFSAHFERISVVCLREGEHALPKSVRVYSLGKSAQGRPASGWERFWSRIRYVGKFYRYAWGLRSEYDAVFVHMNQEYVLLCGPLWRMLGKRVYLWRNHYAGNILTDVAVALSHVVFCTSKYSYTAKFKKTKRMPVGVDTDTFKPHPSTRRVPRSVLFFGRFAPSKRPDVLVDALLMLKRKGVDVQASLYGSALKRDVAYRDAQKEKAGASSGSIAFYEGVPNRDAPRIYCAHEIFVDPSASGMYNKTIFEAAACGCLVVAASEDFREHVDARFVCTADAFTLAARLETLLRMSDAEKDAARAVLGKLARENSLRVLGESLAAEIR